MDYYLDTNNVYKRLKKEFYQYGKLVVAVDFDDTIYDFHNKGRKYNDVIEVVKRFKQEGFAYIVIFTASNEDRYEQIRDYCDSIGICIDAINENIPGLNLPQGKKIYYNILLDDRSGLKESYDLLNELYNEIHIKTPEEELKQLESKLINVGYDRVTISELEYKDNPKNVYDMIENLKDEISSWNS
ncbi:MAG: hypothetical protein ACRCVJ_16565 [Clostridium sp.]|uniref:hypothetical protein n=1 Tax=Clostridium sp. TaxID=1506 RepID=UPI003F32C98E